MKRVQIAMIVCLAAATTYLGVRVVTLKRELYRARSVAQSGLLSVQRACKPIIGMVRTWEPGTRGLQDLSYGCLGSTAGKSERAEYDEIVDSHDPQKLADFIERRLIQQRRLPWRTTDKVNAELLPAMMFDESWIP
jgi:hypothetical protein